MNYWGFAPDPIAYGPKGPIVSSYYWGFAPNPACIRLYLLCLSEYFSFKCEYGASHLTFLLGLRPKPRSDVARVTGAAPQTP